LLADGDGLRMPTRNDSTRGSGKLNRLINTTNISLRSVRQPCVKCAGWQTGVFRSVFFGLVLALHLVIKVKGGIDRLTRPYFGHLDCHEIKFKTNQTLMVWR
jgi:hypothetical protein